MNIPTPKVNYSVKIIGDIKNNIPLVLLHGFLGSKALWNDIVPELNSSVILIDLPGHGESTFKDISQYSFLDWCNDFVLILNQLRVNKINLCGYSMGGRLAFYIVCTYPQYINKLIIESSMPGILDEQDRRKRINQELMIQKKIRKNYTEFIREWSCSSLFIKQKKRNINGWKMQQQIRLEQDESQILLSLKYLGTGSMPSLWSKLNSINMPVLFVNGCEDKKYSIVLTKCFQKVDGSRLVKIPDCGHNIHLEKPREFIETLKLFLE